MAKKISRIIENQIKAWKRQSTQTRISIPSINRFPVITVSREFGAQGAALAELLGEKLDFKVWDKELLQAISKELGSDQKFLETLDERSQQMVENTVAGYLQNIHTNENYLRSLVRVVKTIEEHGSSIIVGRGANYICRNPLSFHVRVVCPYDKRIALYAERMNLKRFEARRIIDRKDTERAEFIERNFYKDVSASSGYDLVINSGTFTPEQMMRIVLDGYESKTGRPAAVPGREKVLQ
ncbi:MAG: cytidylate kinase-like family protein [Balneolaceae bacterium]